MAVYLSISRTLIMGTPLGISTDYILIALIETLVIFIIGSFYYQAKQDFGGEILMTVDDYTIKVKDAVLDFPFHNSGVTTIKETINFLISKREKELVSCIKWNRFRVERGEVVGILGPNGAGKSTLLRLVGGIYKPDRGIVETKGRITLLAGYGLGFSPGLSGRENIHFSGGLLGMTTKELEEMEEEIIEFSELGAFIDSPLWTYSSGMRARLGFSIACFQNQTFCY